MMRAARLKRKSRFALPGGSVRQRSNPLGKIVSKELQTKITVGEDDYG